MKRIFSGVQPTGQIHLGNYFTMKRFVEQQDDNDCFFCVVDMHSITIEQDPKELYNHSLELAALYIAIGLDPNKVTLFIQSQVPAHAELAWILQCNSYLGELKRMTQFKSKSTNNESITTGLFTYPTLMASDILLYGTHYVPVGKDQKQHLELTRDIAQRFNNKYGDTFTIPKPLVAKQGAKIMSLDDGISKMSKSNKNEKSKINVLDDPKVIKKKIMSAKTDSGRGIKFDEENKPEISNLMTIYSLCTGESVDEIEKAFEDKGYGDFKKALAQVVVDELKPIQEQYNQILNSGSIDKILKSGAQRANTIAQEILDDVKQKVGFVTY